MDGQVLVAGPEQLRRELRQHQLRADHQVGHSLPRCSVRDRCRLPTSRISPTARARPWCWARSSPQRGPAGADRSVRSRSRAVATGSRRGSPRTRRAPDQPDPRCPLPRDMNGIKACTTSVGEGGISSAVQNQQLTLRSHHSGGVSAAMGDGSVGSSRTRSASPFGAPVDRPRWRSRQLRRLLIPRMHSDGIGTHRIGWGGTPSPSGPFCQQAEPRSRTPLRKIWVGNLTGSLMLKSSTAGPAVLWI